MIVRPPVYRESAPHKWGVLPQASRNHLLVKGGENLPWDVWCESFYQKFPKEIQAAINKERTEASQTDDYNLGQRIRQMLARLSRRFRPQRIVEHINGTIQGTTTDTYTGMPRGGTKNPGPVNPPSPVPTPPDYPANPRLPSGMKGTVPILVEDGNGGHRGILARRGDGIPKTEWRVFTNGDVEGPPSLWGVCYNERFNEGEFTGLISFNVAFTLFTTEFEYWQAEYPKADPKAVEEVVKHAYEEEMIARIKHIMSLRGKTVGTTPEGEKIPFSQSHAKLLSEPAALTASLFGLINVEQRINTAAGGKFGRKLSTAA